MISFRNHQSVGRRQNFVLGLLAGLVLAIAPASVIGQPRADEPTLNPQQIGTIEPLIPDAKIIVTRMREARELLADKNAGKPTREAQQDAIDELNRFIKAAQQQKQQQQRQQQQSQQQQGQQPQKNQQQQDGQPQGQQNQQSQGNRRSQTGSQQEATETVEKGTTVAAELLRQRQSMVREVWGHLPPRLRNRVLNLNDEKFLPKYEDLIRRYFRAVAEESSRPESD